MKILISENENRQFHMMGLSQDDFDVMKRALANLYEMATGPEKIKKLAKIETIKAMNFWEKFTQAELDCIKLESGSTDGLQADTSVDSGVQLIDLGLPSGTLWADSNLGADAPEQHGDYFRFGEVTPFTKDSPKYVYDDIDGNIAGTQRDAATVILGEKYHTPTFEQIEELLDHCKRMWTTEKGVNGIRVTGPNGNSIFFPAAGYRDRSSGALGNVGSNGYYWSATPYNTDVGRYLNIYSGYWYWNYYDRAYGFSVRPVAEKRFKA